MQRIRILITEMPRSPMLREIFEGVAENSQDMDIVDASPKKSQLAEKIKEVGADVVIIDLEAHEISEIYTDLADANPSAVIVGIVDDGRRILINAKQVGVNELMDTIRAFTRVRYQYIKPQQARENHFLSLS